MVYILVLILFFIWQNTGSFIKGSPPNGSSGRSIALPAAASWYLFIYWFFTLVVYDCNEY